MSIKKFKIRALTENGFVKFYITHSDFKGRIKKHIGKGSKEEYIEYLADLNKEIEQYFDAKVVTFESVSTYVCNYVERMKHVDSIFSYTDEFIALKRNTFNSKTKLYLSRSSINSYIKSIDNFKKFLYSKGLSELPEVLNENVLNDFYYSLKLLSHNYRVKMHFRIKEFISFLRNEKKLTIDISYLKSNFSEQYDNQETDEGDRGLTMDDVYKLNELRRKFKSCNIELPEYKSSKTIPNHLQIKQRKRKMDNLERSLDCFLVMCCTGMYWSDITKVTMVIKNDRCGSYINYRRAKNNSYCKGIPLLDNGCFLGRTIFNEYAIKSGSNFPLKLSLTHFDKNLKIISEMAGLDYIITSKMARKTFASICYFDYEINIQDIQMMLGHKDVKHTQHYLRITDNNFAFRIQDKLRKAI